MSTTREKDRERNRRYVRLPDPLNLALRSWRAPNTGRIVPVLGMTWRIAA
jgi:hypothetical protein